MADQSAVRPFHVSCLQAVGRRGACGMAHCPLFVPPFGRKACTAVAGMTLTLPIGQRCGHGGSHVPSGATQGPLVPQAAPVPQAPALVWHTAER